MIITATEIETEHRAALASMTPAQWRACRRLDEARRLTAFRGCWPAKHLHGIFEREAEARTKRAEHAEQS